MITKLDRFYTALEETGRGVTASNGDYGYFVTVGELLSHGGADEFFRKVRGGKVSRAVYSGLTYDRSWRAYFADCWQDISRNSGEMSKSDVIFIGFDF